MLKPFQKNDRRINRKGRPRTFDPVRLLAQSIAEEPAGDSDPRMTILEGILRQWSQDPKLQPEFLEVAYGRPPPAEASIKLPAGSDLASKGRIVIEAVTAGKLPIDHGDRLMRLLIAQAELSTIQDLERRIAALEGANEQPLPTLPGGSE